ncbi:MAG: SDR family NAD(P)-dependent oxidoreductase [Candidatus Nanopelagicales bacterium]
MGWNITDIPDQSGLTFLITGATSGLGLESAIAIAAAGGDVILAGRSEQRLAAAQERIPQPTRTLTVDLADLASVRDAAASVDHLDVLMNNAGIMAPPWDARRTGSRPRSVRTIWGTSPSPAYCCRRCL